MYQRICWLMLFLESGYGCTLVVLWVVLVIRSFSVVQCRSLPRARLNSWHLLSSVHPGAAHVRVRSSLAASSNSWRWPGCIYVGICYLWLCYSLWTHVLYCEYLRSTLWVIVTSFFMLVSPVAHLGWSAECTLRCVIFYRQYRYVCIEDWALPTWRPLHLLWSQHVSSDGLVLVSNLYILVLVSICPVGLYYCFGTGSELVPRFA